MVLLLSVFMSDSTDKLICNFNLFWIYNIWNNIYLESDFDPKMCSQIPVN